MIDRDYAHHIQFSSDWKVEEDGAEGVHTIDIYDAPLSVVFNVFIKFIGNEYDFSREFVMQRLAEHITSD